MLLPIITGVLLLPGAAWHAAPGAPGVCRLIADTEIQAVQQTALKELKSSDQQVKSLRYQQCVYAATDFAHSVSLTLISGEGDGTRTFWRQTFRPERSEAALAKVTRKKDLPRQIPNLGDDAFWTGDTRAGALYVLTGDQVLRISVGGVSEESERLNRSRTLAESALRRLKAASNSARAGEAAARSVVPSGLASASRVRSSLLG